MDNMSFVSSIVHLNGGSLVGKTRFQKTVYFLEVANLGSGMYFDYHHYGPYSEELSSTVEDSLFLGQLQSEQKKTAQGFEYTEFSVPEDRAQRTTNDEKISAVLSVLKKYDSISVELAATADFLKRSEFEDYWAETASRKPSKATQNRLAKAKQLFSELEPLLSQ
jgi:uncharacterized protein YwgA